MKRACTITLLLALILSATAGIAAAQELPKTTLTVDPLGLLVGAISGEYEKETAPGVSMGFQGLLWSLSLGWDLDLSALGAGVGLKKYVSGRTYDGFYYGGYATAVFVSGRAYDAWTATWESASASTIGVSGVAGMRWLGGNGFVTDLGVHVGIPLVTTVSAGGFSASKLSGVIGSGLSFSVGYAW